jgi:hypothetical protein
MSANVNNTDRSLIYDVGLHLGEDAEFYLKKGFRVLGIEAVADHCAQARERLRQYLDSGQLTILNVAITDRSGPTRFSSMKRTVCGGLRPSDGRTEPKVRYKLH